MADIKIGDSKFYVEQDGRNLGEISFYHDNDSNIVVDHTEVDDELRGQGVGKELVASVVEKARAENKLIVPKCPYAEKQLKKNEDYHDVLITV